MKKHKILSILVFLIVVLGITMFFMSKNEKDKVTESDVKRMVKKEFGIDVEIMDSYVTRAPNTGIFIDAKERERYDYVGRKAKVKTKEKTPIEFEVEVFKYHGKPLVMIGGKNYMIEKKKTP